MSDLYLVRHGQTELNVVNILQGRHDSPLTALGREQAERVGRYFKHEDIAFDHVYSSPLGRTRATASCITDQPPVLDEGLAEWGFGELEGHPNSELPPQPWGDFAVPYGGESQEQVHARMVSALAAIMERPGHERVLAVSHGAVCMEFLEHWGVCAGSLGADGLPCPGNCSIMHYSFEPSVGAFELISVLEQADLAKIVG